MTDPWGIDDEYEDALGKRRPISQQTRRAILASMGVDPNARPPSDSSVRVVRQGESNSWGGAGQLVLEDNTRLSVTNGVPLDLPLGYHEFWADGADHAMRVIVSPPACPLPAEPRSWGWAVQLYATRSTESWGIGDLVDLRRLAHWSASLGARVLLLNPLHAPEPGLPVEPSPYHAGSRRFRNPLYLRVEEVPGFARIAGELQAAVRAGRALNSDRRIRRDDVYRLKIAALERLWSGFTDRSAFDRYRREQGTALRQYATYCVLAEQYGQKWRGWPAEFRDPGNSAVGDFAEQHADRVGFHQWLQWLIDEQLRAASSELAIVHDLAVGIEPEGEEAWAWQDVLAQGARVGAPPDLYNTQGQNWDLPPLIPHKLREAGYEPFIQTVRAALRHAGGLRMDHVLGLFRLFWIPDGASPCDGAYVRYRADELLAIVALEATRANAFIVGEDLGTVEQSARRQLAARQILSCRLLWFERQPPAAYSRLAMAAVTTHDLPTIAGLWSGRDVQWLRELGLAPNEAGWAEMREHLTTMAGLTTDDSVETAIVRAYQALSEAPSRVVTATLEDALAVQERPNIPSTVAEQWPNWSLALPEPLEQLETAPLPRAIADVLGRKSPVAEQ